MAVKVEVRAVGAVTVVKVGGFGCGELLRLVAEGLTDAVSPGSTLVIELEGSVISEVTHLEDFVRAATGVTSDVRIVCTSEHARRVPRLAAATSGTTVFTSVEAALAGEPPPIPSGAPA